MKTLQHRELYANFCLSRVVVNVVLYDLIAQRIRRISSVLKRAVMRKDQLSICRYVPVNEYFSLLEAFKFFPSTRIFSVIKNVTSVKQLPCNMKHCNLRRYIKMYLAFMEEKLLQAQMKL